MEEKPRTKFLSWSRFEPPTFLLIVQQANHYTTLYLLILTDFQLTGHSTGDRTARNSLKKSFTQLHGYHIGGGTMSPLSILLKVDSSLWSLWYTLPPVSFFLKLTN